MSITIVQFNEKMQIGKMIPLILVPFSLIAFVYPDRSTNFSESLQGSLVLDETFYPIQNCIFFVFLALVYTRPIHM